MKKKKKIIIIASLVVVIIGLILAWQGKKRAGQQSFETAQTKLDTLVREVTATGAVKPASEINLEFENQGKIEKILVKKGNWVSAGQELVKLQTGNLSFEVLEATAVLQAAQAKLDKVLAGASQEDIKVYETAVSNVQVTLENKKQLLEDTKADAEEDLTQTYQDIPNILNDAYIKTDDALHKQIDDLFSNDDGSVPELTFSISDSQAQTDSEYQRRTAGQELARLKTEIDNLNENDRNSLDQSLALFKSSLSLVRSFLNTLMEALNNTTGLTSATLASYKASVNTARTNINTALTDITDQQQTIAATKTTNQTNINDAQAAVKTAEVSLTKAQDELALKKAAPKETDLTLAKAELTQARANLLKAQNKFSQATLVAPIDAVVTKINNEAGEMTSAGQAPIVLIGLQDMEIEANISENSIADVLLGQDVTITLDAFAQDSSWQGKVVHIDPAQTEIDAVVYYKVTVAFKEKDEKIKPGMTADIAIQTARKENVLVAPQRTVLEKNGQKFARLVNLDNRSFKETTIETGIKGNQGMIEIISGLKEGDTVVTFIKEK